MLTLCTFVIFMTMFFPPSDVKSESEVLEYLKNGTLVGLLPVPHPIIIRKYQPSDNTEVWFHTYIWGVIYVRWVVKEPVGVMHACGARNECENNALLVVLYRNNEPPVWYDTTINLFLVNKIDAS